MLMKGPWIVAALALVSFAGEAMAQTAMAQTATPDAALATVIEAAKQEGQLTIRSTSTVLGGAEGARIAKDGIKRLFGIDIAVNWAPGPAYGPMASILAQEKQAGQKASTDVYAATAVQISPYLSQGLFQPVDWVGLMPERIKPDTVEAGNRLVRYRTVLPGIIYNLQEAPWVPEIKQFDDLLKPQYQGKFDTTPFLAGFDVMLSDERWGKQKTIEKVQELSKHIGGLLGCEGIDRIASGEVPALALDCSGGWANTVKFRDKHVIGSHVIPDMAQKRYNYLAIPAHAAHPNAGILYALYVSSPEGQSKLVWDLFGSDLASYSDSKGRKQLDELEAQGVKFVDVTIQWWQSHPGIDQANQELAKIITRK
jgi:ABC-type Fe3+ transport system substrate-binding protein